MEFQTLHPDLMALLKERGARVTRPRRAIANHLKHRHGGFTIEALCEELPSVGRATVYRTVKLLLEVGAVCKLALMDGSHVYSVSRVGHRHHHYVCVQCGLVEEFRAASVEKLLRAIGDDLPGQVVDHRIELYVNCGYCPSKGCSRMGVKAGGAPAVWDAGASDRQVTTGSNT